MTQLQVRQLTKKGKKITRTHSRWTVIVMGANGSEILVGDAATVEEAELRAMESLEAAAPASIASIEFKADPSDDERPGAYVVYLQADEANDVELTA